MRLIGLIVMGFFLAAPAMAQTDSAPPPAKSTSHNYARITCPDRVACPMGGAATSASNAALLASANACVKQYFSNSGATTYFSDMGLDGNSCMVPVPGSVITGAGAPLTPSCCVIMLPDSSCVFQCELNGQN